MQTNAMPLGSLRQPGAAAGGRPSSPTQLQLSPQQQAKLQSLDKLLLYSHYIVFQDTVYLDREQHARDFRAHLAMFATRAHLSDQQQFMNRADLNAIIMQVGCRHWQPAWGASLGDQGGRDLGTVRCGSGGQTGVQN